MDEIHSLRVKINALLDELETALQLKADQVMIDRITGGKKISVGVFKAARPKAKAYPTTLSATGLDYVKKNPGKTLSEIAEALDVSAPMLKPHFKKMREEKLVKTRGINRGMRYTAA